MTRRIFLDHHSTTPCDPRVVEAMSPYWSDNFGNPASRNHSYGWAADEAVESAREICAKAINASPEEIVFTSGATEAINLAIKGLRPGRAVASAADHRAVLDIVSETCPVDEFGRMVPGDLKDVKVLSVIHANNEIGTINDTASIGEKCRTHGILLHVDATQTLGKIPIDVEAMKIDLLAASAHKVYGPKGVGFCYVRKGVTLAPLIEGGGHERGLRSGTLNVPGIVGMAEAIRIAGGEDRIAKLRDQLQERLLSSLDHTRINGHPTERLAGNLNISFDYIEAEALMMGMPEIAVSTGSACTSAKLKPSHVLRAIGLSDDLIRGSIRFGIGRFNTEDEIDYAAKRTIEEVKRLRALSPFYKAA